MQKEKLREIIFGYRTTDGKRFDIILLIIIIISVIGLILDSDNTIHQKYGKSLLTIEWICTIIFTIEYIIRIYCCRSKKEYLFSTMGVIDLLSIIPTYLTIFYAPIGSLMLIRIMRLIRIFRIFQLSKYLRSGHTMQLALRSSRPKIIVFIVYISLIVMILGAIMYVVEGQQNGFENIPKSIYWAVVTLTTVGYGDVVPITTLGKTISVFIMMLGYAIIAVPTGIVSSELTKNRKTNTQLRNQDEIISKENEIISKETEILIKLNELQEKIEDLKKNN
jgi:voltage-gated potassium channel